MSQGDDGAPAGSFDPDAPPWLRRQERDGTTTIELPNELRRVARLRASVGLGPFVAADLSRHGFRVAAALAREVPVTCYLGVFYTSPSARRDVPRIGIRLIRSLLREVEAEGATRVVTHVLTSASKDFVRTIGFMRRLGFRLDDEEKFMPIGVLDLVTDRRGS